MRAAIYARTCRAERLHHTTSIANQVEFCRALAAKHLLTVEPEHVYTDVEVPGSAPPSCWAADGEAGRPALSAMVERIEAGGIERVIVRRAEKLGTTSQVLGYLADFFCRRGVRVVVDREAITQSTEPAARFAASILKPCLQCGTAAESERRAKLMARNAEEIARLRARIHRLEAEISDAGREVDF